MEFRDGGHWHYAMVMPDGQEHWARLDYETVRPIEGYSAFDGFADANGILNPDLPRSRWEVSFTEKGGHTIVETRVQYDSAQALQQVIEMGMEEGLLSTLQRLDELLETLAADAA
jgi:uncharacterized protein YndB with AHSA1/START domain